VRILKQVRQSLRNGVGLVSLALAAIGPAAGARDVKMDDPADVTAKLEFLGNPFREHFPDGEMSLARNVWQIQAFAGRLFFGHGNGNNIGPVPNAGPIWVISYDPQTGQFHNEYLVPEENVPRLFVFDDRLLIPGQDPVEGQDGSIYIRDVDGAWQRIEAFPHAVHINALHLFRGVLYVADSRRVSASNDFGRTWLQIPVPEYINEFFEIDGRLYGCPHLWTSDSARRAAEEHNIHTGRDMYVLNEQDKAFDNIPMFAETLFLDHPEATGKGISHTIAFGGKVVFLGTRTLTVTEPIGPYAMRAVDDVRLLEIPVPEGGRVWDLLGGDKMGAVFAVHSLPTGNGWECEVRLLSTTDLQHWQVRARFRVPGFVRSFEKVNDDFYFGLGHVLTTEQHRHWNAEDLNQDTGNLYRLGSRHVAEWQEKP
jgi:hypothetical protein